MPSRQTRPRARRSQEEHVETVAVCPCKVPKTDVILAFRQVFEEICRIQILRRRRWPESEVEKEQNGGKLLLERTLCRSLVEMRLSSRPLCVNTLV